MLEKNKTEKISARDIVALFGAHDLSDANESGRFQLSPKKIYIHDDWNPRTTGYDADLALMEFETGSIYFNEFVQPVCLWDSENEPTITEGVVVGWGKSEDLKKIHEIVLKMTKVPIQFDEECFFEEGKLLDLSNRSSFCAGLRKGSGVCNGDSGGGLFIKVDDVFHLRGIASSSLITDDSCDVSPNVVYTNVLKFKDWIKDIAGADDGGVIYFTINQFFCFCFLQLAKKHFAHLKNMVNSPLNIGSALV